MRDAGTKRGRLWMTHPGVLHQATTILILPSHDVAVAQRKRTLPNPNYLCDRPAHTTMGMNHLMDKRQLYGRGGAS